MNGIFATGLNGVSPILSPTGVSPSFCVPGNDGLMLGTQDMFIADGHTDLLYHLEHTKVPFDVDMEGRQIDLPKLLRAGVRLFFSSLFTEPREAAQDAKEIFRQLGEYLNFFQRYESAVSLIRTKKDIEALESSGKIGVVLHLEGANSLAGSDVFLDTLFEAGLRSVGLTWNEENAFATGAGGNASHGLTPKGRQLIEKLQRLGALIDLAHANALTTSEVLEMKPERVFVSHSNASAIYPSPRNIFDENARKVVEMGGTVGAFFSKRFTVGMEADYPLTAVSRHIRHFLDVIGADGVAIGSDFGGIASGLPEGMEDVGKISKLFELLHSEGVELSTILKIAGRSLRRFLLRNL